MKLYTTTTDEARIERIRASTFRPHSPGVAPIRAPKWWLLRLALAISLRQSVPPPAPTSRRDDDGKEYDLAQVTGEGKVAADDPDITDAVRALLSVYHRDDLFADQTAPVENTPDAIVADKQFLELLLAHIQRGLELMDDAVGRGERIERLIATVFFGDLDARGTHQSSGRGEELISRLLDQGIRARIEDVIRGPRVDKYLLKLASADSLERMRTHIDELSFAMGLPEGQLDVSPTTAPLVAALYIPRNESDWDSYTADDLINWVQGHVGASGKLLPITFGVTDEGKPYCMDLVDGPHVMVAGATGSGKSACLHAIICSLILGQTPSDLHLTLIDPKDGMEFSVYGGMEHLHGEDVVRTSIQSRERLAELLEELSQRNTELATVGASSLSQARRENLVKLPWRVVVVDEMADLVLSDPQTEEYLVRLAQTGRAAGIHLVLATQRPDSKTFSGLLRANIPSRIAMKVAKSSDSSVILDDTGAERLLSKGDMLVRVASLPRMRLQGIFIDQRGVRRILPHAAGKRTSHE